MNGLIEFAKSELDIILNKCKDEEAKKMQEIMNKDILEVIEIFSKQGHSGFSANYAINLITKLLKYEPITPLTGEDNEWVLLDYTDDMEYQNKRCSRVFKDKNGKAYDIDGKIFSDNNGRTWFTKGGGESRTYITFPYSPKTEKVFLEGE